MRLVPHLRIAAAAIKEKYKRSFQKKKASRAMYTSGLPVDISACIVNLVE